jgi:hypothetical protein
VRALGEELLDLCKLAQTDLVLASPFIKVGALGRILEAVVPEVTITCVTRWRPEEVAAGVTDLEVFDVLSQRAGSRILLRSDLHAKYYRADRRVLVGSANLTAVALGWREPSNFELLVSWDVGESTWSAMEVRMLEGTVPATSSLQALVAEAAATIREVVPPDGLEASDEAYAASPGLATPRENWIPRLRHPDLLFAIYQAEFGTITEQGRVDGTSDLAILSPAQGLSKAAFEKTIGATLLQLPTISAIDQFVAEAKRFGEVRAFLRERLGAPDHRVDPAEAWQTIIRWLLHFLPDRYELAVPGDYSEVFRKL